jgi:signal transduction histidine kinase
MNPTPLNPPLPEPKNIIPRAFPGITPREIEELLFCSQIHQYPPGTILTHEGQEESKFYILLTGQVEVTKTINNAEKRQLKTLQSGDFFGEMALIHNAPRAAIVTTTETVSVLEIEKEDFDSVLRNSSSVSIAMVREISSRLRENDKMAIEDLRMRANELGLAYEKLAEHELARREFLNNIAHELRTPLMAAGGFLQLIQRGAITGTKLPDTIDTISRNIQQITALVNDILFLQEMDMILPKFQPVDMGSLTREVIQKYQNIAAANMVVQHLEIDPNLPRVSGDPKTLERALMSLVDNAIKFSPNGGQVMVAVYEENGTVVVRVSDNGIGIEREQLARIFDRFYHIEKSGEQLFRGVGLGLPIANQVIKQHNGRITVQSQPGQGSTFSLHLKALKVVF